MDEGEGDVGGLEGGLSQDLCRLGGAAHCASLALLVDLWLLQQGCCCDIPKLFDILHSVNMPIASIVDVIYFRRHHIAPCSKQYHGPRGTIMQFAQQLAVKSRLLKENMV
jgi:hypothetical protein